MVVSAAAQSAAILVKLLRPFPVTRLHELTILPRELPLDPQSAAFVPRGHLSEALGVRRVGIWAEILQLDKHMSLYANVVKRDAHVDGQVVVHLF